MPLRKSPVPSLLLVVSLACAVPALDTHAAEASPPPETLVPNDIFTLPEGLEVTLWAQSPQFFNPTNIDIDAAGRIWVAEGRNYRRNAGRDPKGDRIVVLEDTDGDGRADSSHVFVQEPGLISPLGVAVIDNQIVVSSAPNMIVYTDVDRDLRFDPRVDRRDVLLTGFNGQNHDHSLHSVTVGPDGLWYFNQGNAGALFTDRSGRTFRVGSAYDPTESGAAGLFGWRPQEIAGAKSDDGHVYVGGFAARMQPDGTNVEIIGFNFRNSYEQTVTSFGDVFQNDNDDPPACRTTFLMEYGNLGFFSRDGSRFWSADRRPGQTTPVSQWRQEDPGTIPAGDVYGGGSPTGIVFYEGDALGESWRGVLLSAEAARNTIFGYFPKPEGAGYALERFHFFTTNPEGVMAGTDMLRGRVSSELKTFFRPSDVAVGTDGAIYVADWFDPRVGGHRDLDETTSGAIYRIAPKGFKSGPPRFDLSTLEGRIAAFKSPAVNVRGVAFTQLRTAGWKAGPPVAKLLEDSNPFIRARAVWLLAQLGPTGIARVEPLLSHADDSMRVAAFRALRRVDHRVLQHAATLARDPSPAVRREAALAMRDVAFAHSLPILLAVADGYDGVDRAYLEAWGAGCTGKELEVYRALEARRPARDATKWPASYAGLIWRLTPAQASADFLARAGNAGLTESDRLAALTALGFIPTREAADAMLELAANSTGKIKDHALWWLLNERHRSWKEHGVDAGLKNRGLYDPAGLAVIPSLVPEPGPSPLPSIAEIATLSGDAARGAEKIQACFLCHRVGDKGIDFGPELTGWAGRQTTEVAIGAIVAPSSDIAHGFDGTALTTTDGTEVHGIVISNGDPLVVHSMGGISQMIPMAKIQKQERMNRSLMLDAGQLGLSAQDVADIVSYLKAH